MEFRCKVCGGYVKTCEPWVNELCSACGSYWDDARHFISDGDFDIWVTLARRKLGIHWNSKTEVE